MYQASHLKMRMGLATLEIDRACQLSMSGNNKAKKFCVYAKQLDSSRKIDLRPFSVMIR